MHAIGLARETVCRPRPGWPLRVPLTGPASNRIQPAQPGSCLFVSHFRTLADPESAALEAVMLKAFGRGVWRTTEQIAG